MFGLRISSVSCISCLIFLFTANIDIVASALSGAFGGLFAFAILHMEGVAGYPGWRWLVFQARYAFLF